MTGPKTLKRTRKSKFAVPEEIEKDIKGKNMAMKWVNLKKLKENYGFHQRDWKPYKIAKNSKLAKENPFITADVDGMFVRGDMVLAVKPMSEHQAYKEELAFYSNLNQGINAKHAEELQERAKDQGVSTQVDVGYGADDGDDD